ncbi:L-threonylcarbamoyladenylate synthase [Hyphobacterium sp. HN65]|uniref:Threonylcarbamoyl-AMP synthase n=1 Tax=Hyphobacterium lacteum TaxID=3116575 RepID=A0ABU7LMX8_9PROT|nr:L-threonylcarbamoyladenylate synthase [Hyphobacterium sp. HN65]MEE2525237.1 L-threonylcarbamoyladenylate synthase [Hyphobacterium sp. HN65]
MLAPILSGSSSSTLDKAVQTLSDGGLVAIPTETVYGLAADATNGTAVAALYAAKGRPAFNPLISHVSGLAMAEQLAEFTPLARQLAQRFWPGPLTLVLPRKPDCPVSELASAGLDTIALRCPGHDMARELISRFGKPLVAPSANPSGGVSPTTPLHVADGLGEKIQLILDGGPCRVGVESTVVGFDGETPLLLRKGGLARSDIEAITGPLAKPPEGSPKASPGMLKSHYAPQAPLRLNATTAYDGETLLGFGKVRGTDLSLSPDGDLAEAAANLFAYLRKLDKPGIRRIAVAPIPDEGLGEAINDRLQRAAAPRDNTS